MTNEDTTDLFDRIEQAHRDLRFEQANRNLQVIGHALDALREALSGEPDLQQAELAGQLAESALSQAMADALEVRG